MRAHKPQKYSIAATAVLSVWLLVQGAACGPRNSREVGPQQKSSRPGTATAQDPLHRCLARVRCYRRIVAYQIVAVTTMRRVLPEAARSRTVTLSGQVKDLVGTEPPATAAGCRAARTRLVQAISLIKVGYANMVRQSVGLIARQLKDPAEDVRKAARLSLHSLRKEMRSTQRKLTGIKACLPFARRK